MSTTPVRPDTTLEIDEETKAILTERLKTIERDTEDSEEWTPELKERLTRDLKTSVSL